MPNKPIQEFSSKPTSHLLKNNFKEQGAFDISKAARGN
jgi:hypothetical protein